MASSSEPMALGAPPLAGPPPGDDDLLGAQVLDLQPAPRARPGLVGRLAPAWRRRPRGSCSRAAASTASPPPNHAGGVCHEGPDRPRPSSRARRSPVGQRQGRAAVEVEQVEDEVGHRDRGGQAADPGRARDVHARLEQREARPPARVERHELAVEHGLGRPHRLGHGPQLGVGVGDVDVVARPRGRAATVDVDHRAHPVPLHLVGPAVVVRRQPVGERRHHRGDPVRQRLVTRSAAGSCGASSSSSLPS